MAHIRVNIIAPDGRTYRAHVEENALGEDLLHSFVKEIRLPIKNQDGKPITYSLSLLNELRIRDGATIKIVSDDPSVGQHTTLSQGPQWSFADRSANNSLPLSQKVFVVHGHDPEARESVARLLEKLGLTAVVLLEQPNLGRTIIESIEAYADVGFAVVLLTPDDVGARKTQKDKLLPRARQNVIFELGYFWRARTTSGLRTTQGRC